MDVKHLAGQQVAILNTDIQFHTKVVGATSHRHFFTVTVKKINKKISFSVSVMIH